MEYNDNFVLPPNEVLEKMKFAYKTKSLTTHILKDAVVSDKKRQEAFLEANESLVKTYYLLKTYKKRFSDYWLNKNITPILEKTKSNIQEIKLLCKIIETTCEEKNMELEAHDLTKQVLTQEVNNIKSLFTLMSLEQDVSSNKIIGRIIHNRLEILNKLIEL